MQRRAILLLLVTTAACAEVSGLADLEIVGAAQSGASGSTTAGAGGSTTAGTGGQGGEGGGCNPGAAGEPCCAGKCADLATCQGGSCVACGSFGGACCPEGPSCEHTLSCSGATCTGCAAEVAAGDYMTCARRKDDSVWCWGWNEEGELGIGAMDAVAHPVPLHVSGLGTDARHLAMGGTSCAVKKDGTLWCWGDNVVGEIGQGTNLVYNYPSPTALTTLGNTIDRVDTGDEHNCAIDTSGSLFCWGYSSNGELGIGTDDVWEAVPKPALVLGPNVASVEAGVHHTCALRTDGAVFCWGDNIYGALGLATGPDFADHFSPEEITSVGTDTIQIEAGYDTTCLLKGDGSVWCWGDNTAGLLGSADPDETGPIQVQGLGAGVEQIGLGGAHACARKQDGSVWCWGFDQYGQLGDGVPDIDAHDVPQQVPTLANTVELSVGAYHACARTSDDLLWCWGDNYMGALGLDPLVLSSPPVLVELEVPMTPEPHLN